MQEIITFLKEIFMLKTEDKIKVGLTQFKTVPVVENVKPAVKKPASEIKLSDLMRRSY